MNVSVRVSVGELGCARESEHVSVRACACSCMSTHACPPIYLSIHPISIHLSNQPSNLSQVTRQARWNKTKLPKSSRRTSLAMAILMHGEAKSMY